MHEQVYDALTFKVETPDGTMYVIVSENELGKPFLVQANIGKAGTALNAWMQAVTLLVTELLANGKSVNDIIALLSELTSERRVLSSGTVPVRSGPDGLCVALMLYRNAKYRELRETLSGDDEEFRAPVLENRRA